MKTFRMALLIITILFTMGATAQAALDVKPIEEYPLFISGEDGYHTYRIPALITTPEGALLAFCEGRRESASDSGPIDLLVRRSPDGGRTWRQPQVVWSDGRNTCGYPTPVVDERTGRIWLFMTHNLGRDTKERIIDGTSWGTRTVWVTHSDDDGRSWAEPKEITDSVKKPEWSWYATGPGVGIQLRRGPFRGRLIIPCDHRVSEAPESYSHVIYSDNGGRSWHIGGVTESGANECQIIERVDRTLLLNIRVDQLNPDDPGTRAISVSEDWGRSWSPLEYDEALPDPRCQGSMIRMFPADVESLPYVLHSNPSDPDRRINMTVRLSMDDGRTWPVSRVVHEGPSAYSCLAMLPDGNIGLLYERGDNTPYETITFARFTLE